MLETPPEEFAEAMLDFLSDSIREIHETQNPARYLRWVKEHGLAYFAPFAEDEDPQATLKMAMTTARRIWNATPLEINRYRPEPLPGLGRNDRCYCGSGKKFKQCCEFAYNNIPAMESTEVWPQLLHNLSPDELTEALESKAIPTSVLVDIASDAFDDEEYQFTCHTLDMIFKYQADMLKEYGSLAVQLMCDAFDELGDSGQTLAFLKIQRQSEHKLVRGAAWQRTAAAHLLTGESEAAWDALHTARKILPDEPNLDTLELYMLLDEGKLDLAQRRAEMLQQQWRRQKRDQDMPEQFAFIQQIVNSPKNTLAQINETEDDVESNLLQRLSIWIESASTIALPAYQTEEMVTEPVEADPLQRDKCYMLETPADLHSLEARWYKVYSGETPMLTQAFSDPETGLKNAQEWLDFLDKHPQAFNSLTILDDLVVLLQSFERLDSQEVYQQILHPIFERVEANLSSLNLNNRFDWGFMENRPLLRLLLNQINTLWYRGEFGQSITLMERQLRLNPQDNQGIRCLLMNAYLKQDDDQKALELSQLYPDDILVDIVLGRVLALYRLGQRKQAGREWTAAQKDLEYANRYLSQSKISRPKTEHSFGVTWGGKEEMWLYREEMRDTWLRTRGVISWLK